MINFNSRLPQTGTTIFTVMSQMAQETGAINLSQGFPDFDCPPRLIELVKQYMNAGYNQYAPMTGAESLRKCIIKKVNRLYAADYNADTDVTVTAGGTQALFTAMATVVQPNDEVIIFEPAYDSYAPAVKALGGLVKPFELEPPGYEIDWDMLKKLVTVRTRMIIINSPRNPTGTIITEEDIKELTAIIRGTDIVILSDEVYEHLVFDGKQHLSMACFPELRERSFICASFGKLFHITGWKIGYCLAPEYLMKEFRKLHQYIVFSVNTPMQYAIANFLSEENSYSNLACFYQEKRDYFAGLMKQTRFNLLPCEGSYFQTATYERIGQEKDLDFAIKLTKEYGVAPIPVSAFYTKATDFGVIRFCFAKKKETLEQAVERLIKV